MLTFLTYVAAGFVGACLYDIAARRIVPNTTRLWRRWRQVCAYVAAKKRIADGTATDHDRDFVHFFGTEWTQQERDDFENRRRSQALHVIIKRIGVNDLSTPEKLKT